MPSILPKAVRDLAQELSRLPSIGPKTAQRLSLHLLRMPENVVRHFAQTIESLHRSVQICKECFSLAEKDLCIICRDTSRNRSIICVVEGPLDVEAIERTDSYRGLYHVLGGVLSPMEGVSADQLTVDELFNRLRQEEVKEVIIALGHTMESDATVRYIMAGIKDLDLHVTRLARGLPTGGDIEFADATTLSAAFEGRRKV
ncbi:MAG: recombination protein RecR [Candidatus Andersenbacteria bacterium]|nr:recombination protein RecR [Candidatus Andersenbacteria bacterium]MBI3250443.1 recombination protein RecR [Candidatus Andersenbacteria bacterium]